MNLNKGPDMSKTPRRASYSPPPRRGGYSRSQPSPELGCGLAVILVIIALAVLVGLLVSSCSVPAGGGSGGTGCEWERKRTRSQSHSLTIVSPTITGTMELVGFSRPGPVRPGGVSRPKISIVKPKTGSKPAGRVVKPGSKPVRMPTVKPHKPTQSPGRGYVWVYDCD